MFMCFAWRLIVLCICVKFRENISNGFQLRERTRVHMLNIYVKFGENISDGIRLMERTRMMEALTDGRTDGHSKFRTV